MSRFSLILAALAVIATPGLAQDNTARNGVAASTNIWAGVYTDAQAAQGQKFYKSACQDCHGEFLQGDPDQGSPGLGTPQFMVEWDGQTMADLVRHIHTLPNDAFGDMDPLTAVQLAAYILQHADVPSGKTPLSTDAKEQAKILFTQFKPQ